MEFPLLDKVVSREHNGMIRPFVEIFVNADGGPKSDGIQTYFGFNFDIKSLFGE